VYRLQEFQIQTAYNEGETDRHVLSFKQEPAGCILFRLAPVSLSGQGKESTRQTRYNLSK